MVVTWPSFTRGKKCKAFAPGFTGECGALPPDRAVDGLRRTVSFHSLIRYLSQCESEWILRGPVQPTFVQLWWKRGSSDRFDRLHGGSRWRGKVSKDLI